MSDLIINDNNYLRFVEPPSPEFSKGLIPRDWAQMEYGSFEYAAKFDIPLIDRDEWPDRIADMERTKTRLSDIIDAAGIPSLDQNGTNFCHANSPALAVMAIRAVQGQPFVLLSPGHLGSIVVGGRNAGAYILDDLKKVVSHGIASQEFVPANYVGLKFKQGTEQNALLHRVTEWWDMPRDDKRFDRMMTLLFHRIPVCTGHNWWRHAVTALDPVMAGKKFGARFRNSWGARYGTNGYFIMEEGKGTPDEAYAPRSVTGYSRDPVNGAMAF